MQENKRNCTKLFRREKIVPVSDGFISVHDLEATAESVFYADQDVGAQLTDTQMRALSELTVPPHPSELVAMSKVNRLFDRYIEQSLQLKPRANTGEWLAQKRRSSVPHTPVETRDEFDVFVQLYKQLSDDFTTTPSWETLSDAFTDEIKKRLRSAGSAEERTLVITKLRPKSARQLAVFAKELDKSLIAYQAIGPHADKLKRLRAKLKDMNQEIVFHRPERPAAPKKQRPAPDSDATPTTVTVPMENAAAGTQRGKGANPDVMTESAAARPKAPSRKRRQSTGGAESTTNRQRTEQPNAGENVRYCHACGQISSRTTITGSRKRDRTT